ncbi:putative pectinesterase/pectinesterase inhibitor 12 [Quercus suber]|uniref:Pectinesterase/pectinesterase inhibitor 12 n=1 Tax=Quercus suber TaxID=58331 RepID=A0AAW0KID4_QUESU
MQTLSHCIGASLMVLRIRYMSLPFDNSIKMAVFQGCKTFSKMPMSGQFTVITAQSRDGPDDDIGNCSILKLDDLSSSSSRVKSYLARSWGAYSRTVYLNSYIDDFINPVGWMQSFDYDNYGLGSLTDDRVTWLGHHIMDDDDACNFIVSEFISGDEWLHSTTFPYDE